MKSRKRIAIIVTALTLTILSLELSYAQVGKEKTIVFPGLVEQISADSKFIVVNEAKIFLSPDAKIIGQNGDSLALYDLKRGSSITLEVVKHGNAFLATKIILKRQGR